MINQPPSRDLKIRRGFTLIELLTVIAIIVILIGILLPVVGAVKRAAYQSSTQALITNLTAAIERYRQDFNAYPGPLSELAILNGTNLGTGGIVSSAENLSLGLLGGWEPNPAGSPSAPFVDDRVGLGPMSFSPIASAARRSSAYIDAVPGTNIMAKPFARWGTNANPAPPAPRDTVIPEFMDQYPDQLPIIYLRARPGMANPNVSGTFTAQYDYRNLTLWYQRLPFTPAGSTTPSFKGDFLMTAAAASADPDEFPSWEEYFHDPNLGTAGNTATYVARQKDGYWLLAAGPDRRYGTRDDQTNFGGFR